MKSTQYLNLSVLSLDVNCEVTLTRQNSAENTEYHTFSIVIAEKEIVL